MKQSSHEEAIMKLFHEEPTGWRLIGHAGRVLELLDGRFLECFSPRPNGTMARSLIPLGAVRWD